MEHAIWLKIRIFVEQSWIQQTSTAKNESNQKGWWYPPDLRISIYQTIRNSCVGTYAEADIQMQELRGLVLIEILRSGGWKEPTNQKLSLYWENKFSILRMSVSPKSTFTTKIIKELPCCVRNFVHYILHRHENF